MFRINVTVRIRVRVRVRIRVRVRGRVLLSYPLNIPMQGRLRHASDGVKEI